MLDCSQRAGRRPFEWSICARVAGTVVALLVCVACGAATPSRSFAAANPIQVENAKPGTTAWNLPGGTATVRATASRSIVGYASEISVQPGDVLHMHVSTIPAAAYRIEIYRLGWYGGTGGRGIACVPSCGGSESGADQPLPRPDPSTGYLDAGWPVTDTITVGSDWTSGYFLAKLILTGGPSQGQASWIPFVVRAPTGARTAILVQASVNTWEAYNNFGGKSLYAFNSSGPVVPASGNAEAAKVSFNRPFALDQNDGPIMWEYSLVRYLERGGYDVSYQTDVDTDSNPSSLLAHRLDVVSGHDEYWSPTMRNAYEAARAAGVNLAFIGGNIGFWQARYESAGRTLVEYRSATLDPNPDPSQKTVQFSGPPVNRPECQLLGIGYPGGATNPTDPPRSIAVTQAALSNPWFKGTGFSAGSTIFDTIGYEWDNLQPGCAVPALQVLLHFDGLKAVAGSPAPADAVTYTAPSGARVISDGSMQVAWALDDFGHSPHADSRAQRLFANIFDDLGAFAAPPLEQPAPQSVVHSPVRFLWTGSPALSSYELTVDNRVKATVGVAVCAAGTCAVSIPLAAGRHSWSVRATDSEGNSGASQTAPFTVSNTAPSRFALTSPRRRAVVWDPAPTLTWTSSRAAAGLAPYTVVLDGKAIAATTRTSYRLERALSDGRHSWSVIASDRAGNRSLTSTRIFFVQSVRLVRHTRARVMAHGLSMQVFCPKRCSVQVRLQLSRHGAAVSSAVQRHRRAGVATITVPASRQIRQRLQSPRTAVVFVTVSTQVGRVARLVALVARWA